MSVTTLNNIYWIKKYLYLYSVYKLFLYSNITKYFKIIFFLVIFNVFTNFADC